MSENQTKRDSKKMEKSMITTAKSGRKSIHEAEVSNQGEIKQNNEGLKRHQNFSSVDSSAEKKKRGRPRKTINYGFLLTFCSNVS